MENQKRLLLALGLSFLLTMAYVTFFAKPPPPPGSDEVTAVDAPPLPRCWWKMPAAGHRCRRVSKAPLPWPPRRRLLLRR